MAKDYIVQNGIRVYRKGKAPVLPKGTPSTNFKVLSRFGFRLVTIKDRSGKKSKIWMVATEEDYRACEATRLGIKPDKVKVSKLEAFQMPRDCQNDSPTHCHDSGCPFPENCNLLYDPVHKIHYCQCG